MEKANINDRRLRKYTSRKVADKMGVKENSYPDLANFPKQAK